MRNRTIERRIHRVQRWHQEGLRRRASINYDELLKSIGEPEGPNEEQQRTIWVERAVIKMEAAGQIEGVRRTLLLSEARSSLSRAFECKVDTIDSTLVRIPQLWGSLDWLDGNYEEAKRHLDDAVELQERLPARIVRRLDRPEIASALLMCDMARKGLRNATGLCDKANKRLVQMLGSLVAPEAVRDRRTQAHLANNLVLGKAAQGIVANARKGDPALGISYIENALANCMRCTPTVRCFVEGLRAAMFERDAEQRPPGSPGREIVAYVSTAMKAELAATGVPVGHCPIALAFRHFWGF